MNLVMLSACHHIVRMLLNNYEISDMIIIEAKKSIHVSFKPLNVSNMLLRKKKYIQHINIMKLYVLRKQRKGHIKTKS